MQFRNKNSEAMSEISNAQGVTKCGMLFHNLPRAIALMNPSDQSMPSIIGACQKKYAPLGEETRKPREKRLNKELLT